MRSHSDDDDPDDDGLPPISAGNVTLRNDARVSEQLAELGKKSASGDAEFVAGHYNARPQGDRVDRSRSAILSLRLFNNWVKSVMVREFVRGRALKVLDLACGKGGDLGKWDRLSVVHFTGIGRQTAI